MFGKIKEEKEGEESGLNWTQNKVQLRRMEKLSQGQGQGRERERGEGWWVLVWVWGWPIDKDFVVCEYLKAHVKIFLR